MWILGMILVLLAGISEAVMDKLQFHYDKSVFISLPHQIFWDPLISWKNKWKDGDKNNGEKFWGSSTIFVGFTDAWHFFKLLKNLFTFGGLLLIAVFTKPVIYIIILFIIARIIYGLAFTTFFDKLLHKKINIL